jgi:hypothetical protein
MPKPTGDTPIGEPQPQIPDDLRVWYSVARDKVHFKTDYDAIKMLIERIGRAESDRDYFKQEAEIRRVTVVEMRARIAELEGEPQPQDLLAKIDAVMEEYRAYSRQNDPEVCAGLARLLGAQRVADLVRAALAGTPKDTPK